jgi:Tol biopolymer transport system component
MKKILRRKTIPLLLTAVLLVVIGAGAAAGTVLAGKVTGIAPVAVSQALLTEAPVWQSTCDINKLLWQGTNSDYMTQQVYLHNSFISAPSRFFGAVADDNTGFQAAAEIAVGDWVSFNLPLKNASENPLGATLTLNIPDGLEVEVWRSSMADNINNVVRTSTSTWRIEVAAAAEYDHEDDCLMFTINADDIAAPGYYTISGTLSQISLGSYIPGTFSTRGRIVFHSDRGIDGDNEIYVMDADGSNLIQLTDNAADEEDMWAVWSPLGDMIAFTSDRDGNNEIYVMNADGTNPTRLTDNAADDKYPAWSPNGEKIAFTSNRDGNNEIYVMNADGTNVLNLTNDAGFDTYPAWSPDSTRIAFNSTRDGGDYDIFVMNADGTCQTNLTDNDVIDDCYPSWSPCGDKIAFSSFRAGDNEIFVMDADGTDETQLTDNGDEDWAPDWSPDATQLVYSKDLGAGNYEIFKMNADGTGQTNLTIDADVDDIADW